jgi:hypothetical protein
MFSLILAGIRPPSPRRGFGATDFARDGCEVWLLAGFAIQGFEDKGFKD